MDSEDKKTVDRILDEMKDFRVHAIVGKESKPMLIELMDTVTEMGPSSTIRSTAESLKAKLQESLETDDLLLSIGEVALMETIVDTIGAKSSGIQTVDSKTGEILRSTGTQKNIGRNIKELYKEEKVPFRVPHSNTIH